MSKEKETLSDSPPVTTNEGRWRLQRPVPSSEGIDLCDSPQWRRNLSSITPETAHRVPDTSAQAFQVQHAASSEAIASTENALNQDSLNSNLTIVIDGSNVARYSSMGRSEPQIARIQSLITYLRKGRANLKVFVILDASTRYFVSDPEMLKEIQKLGVVHEVPGKMKADDAILNFAAQKKAIVITNDQYREYESQLPEQYRWYRDHCIRFSLLEDVWTLSPTLENLGNG